MVHGAGPQSILAPIQTYQENKKEANSPSKAASYFIPYILYIQKQYPNYVSPSTFVSISLLLDRTGFLAPQYDVFWKFQIRSKIRFTAHTL